MRLAATKLHKLAIVVLGVVVICWTIAITTSVVFECALPHPWEVFSGKCIDPVSPQYQLLRSGLELMFLDGIMDPGYCRGRMYRCGHDLYSDSYRLGPPDARAAEGCCRLHLFGPLGVSFGPLAFDARPALIHLV
jgi:hypothetical protein